MRAIIDTFPPYGVRELAQSTRVSAPTLSRVLDLLEREAIVTRMRGAVSVVDWQGAIRRWIEDYDQTDSNTPTMTLEPRGLPAFEKKLRATKLEYVATGAFAAQRFDPIAPARQAAIYVTDHSSQIPVHKPLRKENEIVSVEGNSEEESDAGGLRIEFLSSKLNRVVPAILDGDNGVQ